MKIPPDYKITSEILDLISKIEANRIYFSSINIPILVKEKIQRASILKSSLFSARIEGNPLTIEKLQDKESDEVKRIEVFNILKAAKFIDKDFKEGVKVTKKIILILHSIIMNSLSFDAGRFRTEASAIFNQSAVAVYVAPPPDSVPVLIDKLLKYTNSGFEKFPIINAFITHLIFEKIHPFIDGNGRVGRLLIFSTLKSHDRAFPIAVPFEEYLDANRDDYYYFLGAGVKKPNDYLLFMLNAFYSQTEKVKKEIEAELEKKETLLLPPRQEEIFNIIKDHPYTSFDVIRRRFLQIPERTLRFDIKRLLDMKLIIRIGKTRGSYYKIFQSS